MAARRTSSLVTLGTAVLAGALVGAALTAASPASPAAAAQGSDGPLLRDAQPAKGKAVPGSYIVVLQEGTKEARKEADRLARANGGSVSRVYETALKGFAGEFSDKQVAKLKEDPAVVSVEQDFEVAVTAVQTPATWGLDRVDQRAMPLSNSYTYPDGAGAGVHAYVVDTGIKLTHAEFAGRMSNGFDAVTSGGNANDCNGHGTHVAGTVGGTTYGVAKKVTLHAVRVLGCSGSGTNAGVIAGVDWVAANHVKPAVANMSLGGGASTATDNAVANAISKGVTFVVAAGNDNANACNYSPARAAAAITVGSTTNTDARSSFSNFGTCLDVFAPGSNITSAWYTSDSATNTISGTSMASPHVAGVAALAAAANPTGTPQTIRDAIVNSGTTGVVTSAGSGSPNVLAYSLLTATPGPTPTPTPTPTPQPSVLQNGGFESGRVAWTESSSAGYALIVTSKPRTGAWGAWLGGYNGATETLTQSVTVPTNGTLTYWYRVETSETGSTVYDRLAVRVLNSTGTLLATPRTLSNASTRNTWVQDTISLASYAGQTVQLQYRATTDSSLATSFFLDDVAVG